MHVHGIRREEKSVSVTLKQIAQQAGVSRGTVDRALHRRPGVRPEVAESIRRIASELGYRPNLAGKLLVDGQNGGHRIGVILIEENNPFYEDIRSGAESAAGEFQEFGITTELKSVAPYDAEGQLALMEQMVIGGVGGIVMTPIMSPLIDERIGSLKRDGIPVITINSDTQSSQRLVYVGCEHEKSGKVLAQLVSMLADGREKKIAVLAGSRKNLSVRRRSEGFLRALRESSPNVKIGYVCYNECLHDWEDINEVTYSVAREILQREKSLDYICVMGSGIGGAIRAVREAGGDAGVKLLVYDLIQDVRDALRDGIVLATVLQEPFRQGYQGVELMAKNLAFGQQPEGGTVYTDLTVVLGSCIE